MAKKLTISVSDEFYERLQSRVGKRGIGRFLEKVARPYVIPPRPSETHYKAWLDEQYRAQAAEEAADPALSREIQEWIETGVDKCLPDDWDEWSVRYEEWKRLNAPR